MWDQESTTWAARERPDAGLVEEPWCELLGQGLGLAGELAFLDGQLLDAARDGAEREQRATQLLVLPAVGPGSGEARQQPGLGEGPQLGPQRLGCRDKEVTELAEAGPFRVHRTLTSGHQGP